MEKQIQIIRYIKKSIPPTPFAKGERSCSKFGEGLFFYSPFEKPACPVGRGGRGIDQYDM
jgi:hypothetical protein